MLQFVDASHRLKMLARLDTALFLLAPLTYGALGFGVGLVWWCTGSRVGDLVRRLRRKEPREARDFYELFLYELLSLGFSLGFVIFLIAGWKMSTGRDQGLHDHALTHAAEVLLYALLFYLVFRVLFWTLNKIPSLPMLRCIRNPLFHGICGGVTVTFLLALASLHPCSGPQSHRNRRSRSTNLYGNPTSSSSYSTPAVPTIFQATGILSHHPQH